MQAPKKFAEQQEGEVGIEYHEETKLDQDNKIETENVSYFGWTIVSKPSTITTAGIQEAWWTWPWQELSFFRLTFIPAPTRNNPQSLTTALK